MNITEETEVLIAVAEVLGWELCRDDNKTWRTPEQAARNKELIGTEDGPWSFESPGPPNYPRCLNAMAEAEKAQAPEQLTAYIIELGILVTGYVTLASPAHRSLAFLRTMQPDNQRWKEIQP